MNLSILPAPEILTSSLPLWVASWFGTGLIEPLRAGFAVATVSVLALFPVARVHAFWAILLLATVIGGVWAAHSWELLTGMKDDRRIVVDEVAGYMAAMAVAGTRTLRFGLVIGAIYLALDKIKPWPFHLFEQIEGGLGVMLDDVMLGLALGLILVWFDALRPSSSVEAKE